MHRAKRIAIAAPLLALAACANIPSHTVQLEVLALDDKGVPHTVRGARVTAAPLNLSAVPLPVTPENLALNKISNGVAQFTAPNGRVTLKLAKDRAYLVEVESPIAGPWQAHPDARYLFTEQFTLREADTNQADARRWSVRVDPPIDPPPANDN